jgi:hypothetical protein
MISMGGPWAAWYAKLAHSSMYAKWNVEGFYTRVDLLLGLGTVMASSAAASLFASKPISPSYLSARKFREQINGGSVNSAYQSSGRTAIWAAVAHGFAARRICKGSIVVVVSRSSMMLVTYLLVGTVAT